ncbi:MAG: ATP-binding protein [Candidatus Polarisedimenticolaceae bacterium]|nr:ATP-binding protein [Candidatus Polarisedimenticolaceae bacterium]
MTLDIHTMKWKPVTVSLVSFLLLALIVAGAGWLGGDHIVGYLQERITQHGVEHNEEIAEGILPLLQQPLEESVEEQQVVKVFQAFIEHATPFGVQIFLIDRETHSVIAGSEKGRLRPTAFTDFLSQPITRLSGEPIADITDWQGPARSLWEDGAPLLLHFQKVPGSRWSLGLTSDYQQLTEFVSDLRWHFDLVLLLTGGLIATLGFAAVRWVGRAYESDLEAQVKARTRDLEATHREMLSETRLATIGRMATVLTHEMRNPLASIKLALSGLRGSDYLQQRDRQRVNLVLGEVDRLNGMLSETLDYARPIQLSEKPGHLDHLLDRVLELEEPLLTQKKIQISRQVCSDSPAIRLDAGKMQQVLLNLIKNAIEASPTGGEISIVLRREGQKVILELINGGTPMESETVARAFEPFFTTKPKGTGLGLGLVKRIVEEHGGEVTIQSDSRTGTCVTLVLPVITPNG